VLKRIKNLVNSFLKKRKEKKQIIKEKEGILEVQDAFRLDQLQYSPGAVGFSTQELQFSIYQHVSKYIDADESIIDFGCGRGDFLAYRINRLGLDVDYLGIDKDLEIIDAGRSIYKGIQLECLDWNSIETKWDKKALSKDCAINILSCNVNYDNILNLNSEQYLLNIIDKMMSVSKKGILTFFEKSIIPEDNTFIEYDIKSLTSILTKKYNITTDYILKDMLLTLVITHK